MGRPRKNPFPDVPAADLDAAKGAERIAAIGDILRADLPALLAKAKQEGDREMIDAILARCSGN